MSKEASVLRIPNFVKARSPNRLRELMLEVNARDGLQYDWLKSGISFNPTDKMWYAWYNQEIDIDRIGGRVIDGN